MDVKKIRKILGKSAKDMTDKDVLEVENTLGVLADIAIDSFLSTTPKQREFFQKLSRVRTPIGRDLF